MTAEDTKAMKSQLQEAIAAGRQRLRIGDRFEKFSTLYQGNRLDRSLHGDFGWLIYYQLRNTPLNSILPRKRLLLLYLRLELERPSLLHSLMLAEALKMKRNSPSQFKILDFLALWGLENLREEDWEKFKPDKGQSHNSLVENLIATCALELKGKQRSAPDDFSILVDRAVDIYKTNPNLPLYKGLVLVSQNRREEALAYYKTLLRRWPKKFFLWSQAEDLVPYMEFDLKIALLCRAMNMSRDRAFLGDIPLRLANVLCKKGLYGNARYELEEYIRYYTSQGWKIKPWCDVLLARVKAGAPNLPANPTPYSDFLPLADRFITE